MESSRELHDALAHKLNGEWFSPHCISCHVNLLFYISQNWFKICFILLALKWSHAKQCKAAHHWLLPEDQISLCRNKRLSNDFTFKHICCEKNVASCTENYFTGCLLYQNAFCKNTFSRFFAASLPHFRQVYHLFNAIAMQISNWSFCSDTVTSCHSWNLPFATTPTWLMCFAMLTGSAAIKLVAPPP